MLSISNIIFYLLNMLNLSNSFNKFHLSNKHCINYKSKINLNMGCDYYIDKNLNIYDYNNNILSYINLEHQKGYYWFVSILDEDEDGYDNEYKDYIKYVLKPQLEPITIYTNNNFTKLSFEKKYKTIIESEIKKYNKTLLDINKIIKIERRYER
jgi:hypothetical protein